MVDSSTAGAAWRPPKFCRAARPRLVDCRPRVDRPSSAATACWTTVLADQTSQLFARSTTLWPTSRFREHTESVYRWRHPATLLRNSRAGHRSPRNVGRVIVARGMISTPSPNRISRPQPRHYRVRHGGGAATQTADRCRSNFDFRRTVGGVSHHNSTHAKCRPDCPTLCRSAAGAVTRWSIVALPGPRGVRR